MLDACAWAVSDASTKKEHSRHTRACQSAHHADLASSVISRQSGEARRAARDLLYQNRTWSGPGVQDCPASLEPTRNYSTNSQARHPHTRVIGRQSALRHAPLICQPDSLAATSEPAAEPRNGVFYISDRNTDTDTVIQKAYLFVGHDRIPNVEEGPKHSLNPP